MRPPHTVQPKDMHPRKMGLLYLLHHTQNNYLCTYDLYGPVRNVFDAGRYITWASASHLPTGWALEMERFLGPVKWPSTPFILPLQLGPLASPPPTPHLPPPPLLIQNFLEITSH
jgi:hypothetical protein